MQFENVVTVPAPVPLVWESLSDLRWIASCLSYSGTARLALRDDVAYHLIADVGAESAAVEARMAAQGSATLVTISTQLAVTASADELAECLASWVSSSRVSSSRVSRTSATGTTRAPAVPSRLTAAVPVLRELAPVSAGLTAGLLAGYLLGRRAPRAVQISSVMLTPASHLRRALRRSRSTRPPHTP